MFTDCTFRNIARIRQPHDGLSLLQLRWLRPLSQSHVTGSVNMAQFSVLSFLYYLYKQYTVLHCTLHVH